MYWRETMMGGYGDYSPFLFGGIGLIAIWDLAWKGIALWRAARRKEQWWFLALLLVNSMGLLPIAYLMIWGKDDPDMAKMSSKTVKVLKKRRK